MSNAVAKNAPKIASQAAKEASVGTAGQVQQKKMKSKLPPLPIHGQKDVNGNKATFKKKTITVTATANASKSSILLVLEIAQG